jgi:arylsulfatase A-like enzyme
MYVAYDEAIHVPLIFSNPLAFPQPAATDSLASLIDLVPTLAAVAGAIPPSGAVGKDLTPVLEDPSLSVRDAALFSYDDQFNVSDSVVAAHIRALRLQDWTYSVYFSETAGVPPEFELYNLMNDPGQMVNLLSLQHYQPDILEQWMALNTLLLDLARELGAMPAQGTLPPSSSLNVSLLEASAQPIPATDAATAPFSMAK